MDTLSLHLSCTVSQNVVCWKGINTMVILRWTAQKIYSCFSLMSTAFICDETLQYSVLVPLFMVTCQINTIISKLRKKQILFFVFIMTVLSQYETAWQILFNMKTRHFHRHYLMSRSEYRHHK